MRRPNVTLALALILCIGTATASRPQAKLEGWRLVGSTKDDYVYFQLKSVRGAGKGIVKAWVRFQYRNTATEQMGAYLNTHKDLQYYEAFKYAYVLELEEFNCTERKSRTSSHLRYDFGGEYLSGTQTTSDTWIDVVPESIGEIVLDGVCDYYYAQLDDFLKDIPPAKPKQSPARRTKRTRH